MMRLILATSVLMLWGCQSLSSSSLYDELGGMPAIEKITDNFIEEISFDQHIMQHFKDSDIDRFRSKLIEQLCVESGGPCEYTGDSMVEVHTGMNISEAEFNRTVDLLINAMNKAGIPHTAQNKLLARLAPMRGDMIYR